MTLNEFSNARKFRKSVKCRYSIVVNGYSNLVSAVEVKARQTVEAKHSERSNSAGWLGRWTIQRMLKKEIKELSAKLTPKVSPDALF